MINDTEKNIEKKPKMNSSILAAIRLSSPLVRGFMASEKPPSLVLSITLNDLLFLKSSFLVQGFQEDFIELLVKDCVYSVLIRFAIN